jgi:hypothetical protein
MGTVYEAEQERPRRTVALKVIRTGVADLCLVSQDKHAEAEPLLRESLAVREAKLPPDHWQRFQTRSVLGAALAGQGRREEAEGLLLSATRASLATRRARPAQGAGPAAHRGPLRGLGEDRRGRAVARAAGGSPALVVAARR